VGIVFGPVPSRRLGISLGIDLLPPHDKPCTMDCVYCEVGCTRTKTTKRGMPVPTAEVNRAIDAALPTPDIDVVSFTGSGEPTLHKDLGQFIDRVKARCRTPVAVITNASLIDRPDVRRDLAKADLVLPSLDAVTPAVFERINRPHPAIRVDRIVEGLVQFRQEYAGKIFLEIMIVKGLNDDPGELLALKKAADRIRPDQIHLSTVTRPPAESFVQPVSPADLARLALVFGERAARVGSPPPTTRRVEPLNWESDVLGLVRRRGVTLVDLTSSLGLSRQQAEPILERLIQEKKIKKVVYGGVTYFREFY
jgi:wyosine [tRNA(Phe)-imidazoG37] synthetase (radical SAM superfamily)